MLTLICTSERDSSNSYPVEQGTFISVSENTFTLEMSNPDRIIRLSKEDTKQLLKLLKFELEN